MYMYIDTKSIKTLVVKPKSLHRAFDSKAIRERNRDKM